MIPDQVASFWIGNDLAFLVDSSNDLSDKICFFIPIDLTFILL